MPVVPTCVIHVQAPSLRPVGHPRKLSSCWRACWSLTHARASPLQKPCTTRISPARRCRPWTCSACTCVRVPWCQPCLRALYHVHPCMCACLHACACVSALLKANTGKVFQSSQEGLLVPGTEQCCAHALLRAQVVCVCVCVCAGECAATCGCISAVWISLRIQFEFCLPPVFHLNIPPESSS